MRSRLPRSAVSSSKSPAGSTRASSPEPALETGVTTSTSVQITDASRGPSTMTSDVDRCGCTAWAAATLASCISASDTADGGFPASTTGGSAISVDAGAASATAASIDASTASTSSSSTPAGAALGVGSCCALALAAAASYSTRVITPSPSASISSKLWLASRRATSNPRLRALTARAFSSCKSSLALASASSAAMATSPSACGGVLCSRQMRIRNDPPPFVSPPSSSSGRVPSKIFPMPSPRRSGPSVAPAKNRPPGSTS
mmetsp:Transcript_42225/g.83562  ORF Transcript_42225/g.83562 Transcript_42225/m.83562 type:complete len:261 (+) Transcript_42225:393-1175(+)